MPSKLSQKKDLYLGKCLGDLHKLSDIKQLPQNVTIVVKSSNKVFQDAESYDQSGDEERALVLYMKYFNILKLIKSKAEYKKQKDYFDNLIGKKNQLKAIERLEELTDSLKNRYELLEAEAVAKKLDSLPEKKPDQDLAVVENQIKEESQSDAKKPVPTTSPTSPAVITCVDLCNLLRDSSTKLIVMDVRTHSDFLQSHISHTDCISVPEEIIVPGSTVNHIQAKLPSESVMLWQQRQHVDHIILLDWRSTLENVTVGTALRTLKDALYKFDLNTIIKSEPLILEGGYDKWLLFYPTITTNAHVTRPSDEKQDKPPSPTMTLDFDYPDLEPKLPMSEPSPMPVQGSEGSVVTAASLPQFDRKLKPASKPDSNLPSTATLNTAVNGAVGVPAHAQSTGVFLPANNKLYPSVSTSVQPDKESQIKNTNYLADKSSGPRSINLSVRNDLKADLSQSTTIREAKEAELQTFKHERDNILQEHRHRLRETERQLQELEEMKKKEQKDVADLLRMKRKLNEEIEDERRKQTADQHRLDMEEEQRIQAVEKARNEEEEKRKRMEEVEKLRQDRKREEEIRLEMKKKQEEEEMVRRGVEESQARDATTPVTEAEDRQTEKSEEHNQTWNKERQQRAEEDRLAEQRKEEERAKERKQLEEEQLRKEERKRELKLMEEERQRLEAKRLKEAKMKEEAEKRELEKKKAEIERKKKEEMEQKKNEMEKQIRDTQQPTYKVVPSTMLPSGWEKRLDRATNRYFYIDHNEGTTQWSPPDAPLAAKPSAGTYTVKLKDEPSVSSSRGLSRSHSSPDIKKQLEEEEQAEAKKQIPTVNRASKPSKNQVVLTPKQAAYVARKRDLNPVYGNVGPALTGLRNLGNTCYMNSTIQCLNNTSPLVSYFLNDNYTRFINRESSQGMHGEVVDEFAVVIKALWAQQYRSITPRDLKNVVGKYNPMFSGYQQQDSQEFLTFLLDGLHEGLNEVRKAPDIPEQNNDNLMDKDAARLAWEHHKRLHKSVIVELFQGQLKSTLMCRTCRKTSVTFQAFMFLSLPIPGSSRCTLKDCIQEFLKPEMMTGSSRWKCPQCKVERDSEKKIDIWKLPPILLVGLNRFYSEGMWMQKKSTYVDFPVSSLDFSSYIIGPPPRNRYNLYGISNHYGTMEGGHYTAFCKNPGNKKWYKFDDQDVYEMSASDVKTSAAFVLYYSSIDMPAPTYMMPHL